MTALTITAVNTGTDQLTITGHGLVTGAGACNAFNVGGGLPAPLAALTNYWVIFVDANTIKLATSQANALAGTAIDITTTGSGTNQILIGLPTLRNRTYTPSSQVFSADINAIQDNQIGSKRSSFYRAIMVGLPIKNAGGWTAATGVGTGLWLSTSSVTPSLVWQVPFEPGDRITGIVATAKGNSSVNATYFVGYQPAATMTQATLLSEVDTARPNTFGLYQSVAFTPQLLSLGDYLTLEVDPNGASYVLGPIFARFDRL